MYIYKYVVDLLFALPRITYLPRTLWGADYGECTTCLSTGSALWTCPATLEAYADLGGTNLNIIEKDGNEGKSSP